MGSWPRSPKVAPTPNSCTARSTCRSWRSLRLSASRGIAGEALKNRQQLLEEAAQASAGLARAQARAEQLRAVHGRAREQLENAEQAQAAVETMKPRLAALSATAAEAPALEARLREAEAAAAAALHAQNERHRLEDLTASAAQTAGEAEGRRRGLSPRSASPSSPRPTGSPRAGRGSARTARSRSRARIWSRRSRRMRRRSRRSMHGWLRCVRSTSRRWRRTTPRPAS